MRRINSSDLPQADRVESVLLTVLAVAHGARTDLEIANKVPGIQGDDRQGRYYRKAAEMLGFIENHKNNSTLTTKGNSLVQNPTISNSLFISSVLNLEIYQKLLPYLELHPAGRTRKQIIDYLQLIAEPSMGSSMIPRRISTILAWPRSLGFLNLSESGYFKIQNNFNNEVPFFKIHDYTQPLLPATGELNEYEEIEKRVSNAINEILVFKDQAKLERASNSHVTLVNLIARRIREIGGIPKSNQLIDLAVRLDQDYIFEMKSTNNKNSRSQIRKGISQLYEYRYLQNKPQAKLILVIENPLNIDQSWMLDYLEMDRNINLVWDGNNKLFGTEKTKKDLPFLNLS
ncbi:MAG: hypothetical protein PHC38_10965 [Weeksellaceae bacterium]|jgi:hypothetical protein|nr:hypothetical protein [Weeksellaceae bacterium]MDX9697684.1 hypothetical protein [Bacteroidales bacterium]